MWRAFRNCALLGLFNGAKLIYFLAKRSHGLYWKSLGRGFFFDSCKERDSWACGCALYMKCTCIQTYCWGGGEDVEFSSFLQNFSDGQMGKMKGV